MRRSVRPSVLLMLVTGSLVGAGCGDDENGSAGAAEQPVIVSAAASLTEALTTCQDDVPGVKPRLSFAGSDELAAQIRQGVKPDVYLAANTKLPGELQKEGRLGAPVAFATNELVLAVPRDSDIAAIGDLDAKGVTIVIGSASVPIGSYTRDVLARLGNAEEKAILANVRSNEPDVKGVVGKLVQSAADAGFVYKTDVVATKGKLKAIELPSRLQPTVAYGGGIVKGAPHAEAAQEYLDSVTSGACADAIGDAGFGPAPS
ncbi:MAG: molybdate ABC transporter substrate-binding protein [Solirubrobacteraceae bacterium]